MCLEMIAISVPLLTLVNVLMTDKHRMVFCDIDIPETRHFHDDTQKNPKLNYKDPFGFKESLVVATLFQENTVKCCKPGIFKLFIVHKICKM